MIYENRGFNTEDFNPMVLAVTTLLAEPHHPRPQIREGYKQCSSKAGCGKILPLGDFHLNGRRPNGDLYYGYTCKPCTKIREQERRARKKAAQGYASQQQ